MAVLLRRPHLNLHKCGSCAAEDGGAKKRRDLTRVFEHILHVMMIDVVVCKYQSTGITKCGLNENIFRCRKILQEACNELRGQFDYGLRKHRPNMIMHELFKGCSCWIRNTLVIGIREQPSLEKR